jgi:hypothetical protein
MKIAFTICTNSYLPRALTLRDSFLQYHPNDEFHIILVDREISLQEPLSTYVGKSGIIPIERIEPAVAELAAKYNIVELSTAVKPTVFSWFLKERPESSAFIYLDPDLCFYSSLNFIEDYSSAYKIFLTPHILEPIADDHAQPSDNLFLKYGIYNLGFIYIRADHSVNAFLDWWKSHTYTRGYINPDKGQFLDQLPLNLAPLFFEYFFILRHAGLNVGPWNFQERKIAFSGNRFIVNGKDPLVFVHYSDYSPEFPEKISHRNWYPRNQLVEGTILYQLYHYYGKKLLAMGFHDLSGLKSIYHKSEPRKPLRSRLRQYIRRQLKS